MRLRYELVVMDLGDEYAAVPVNDSVSEFHGMLKLNAVSADIIGQLKEETTPDRVHAYLKDKYPDSTDDEIGQAVVKVLNQLAREGLLIY